MRLESSVQRRDSILWLRSSVVSLLNLRKIKDVVQTRLLENELVSYRDLVASLLRNNVPKVGPRNNVPNASIGSKIVEK